MKLYLAGPMRGIPEFNFPKFHRLAAALRKAGFEVFSPAERDIERHNGVDVSLGNIEGSEEVAATTHGFNLRDALHDDLVYITKHADGIFLMDGWHKSKGAMAEKSTASALGLVIMFESGSYELS